MQITCKFFYFTCDNFDRLWCEISCKNMHIFVCDKSNVSRMRAACEKISRFAYNSVVILHALRSGNTCKLHVKFIILHVIILIDSDANRMRNACKNMHIFVCDKSNVSRMRAACEKISRFTYNSVAILHVLRSGNTCKLHVKFIILHAIFLIDSDVNRMRNVCKKVIYCMWIYLIFCMWNHNFSHALHMHNYRMRKKDHYMRSTCNTHVKKISNTLILYVSLVNISHVSHAKCMYLACKPHAKICM